MRSKIIILIILLGILWGIRSPMGAAFLYSWITLFRPQDFVYINLPSIVPMAFAILTGSILIAAFQKRVKLLWNIGSSHLLTIVAVCFLSVPFSSSQDLAWEGFIRVSKIIAPSILIGIIISTEQEFRFIVSTFAVSIGVWAVQGAVYGVLTGGAAESMSIGGQMSDRNDFAVGVLMTVPLCYYLALNHKNKLIKLGGIGVAGLAAICVIVSNSRGGMLGLAIVMFLNFMRKGTKRWRNLFLMIVSSIIIYPMIPDYAIERLSTIELSGEQTEGSAKSRTILMKAGLDGAFDNPVFGVGTGCWAVHADRYVPGGKMGDGAVEPHCIWIKISAELGFIGLSAYVLMFARIVLNLRRIQKKCLETQIMDYYNYAFMLQMSLFGYFTAGTFINQIYYEYTFLLVAVSGAFIRLFDDNADRITSTGALTPVQSSN